ncbi:LysR family transcriptional regulator [Halodurantibacterium flavum]|uniref:LysR family transcriptional regulator n=1 Tax=Halodurantibacterium flavum TaxID=1382802 RepID=A0ABW4S2Z9_9RHOB
MELKLLEDFLCLNDTRNFSRAAELRHVTQSTLSKRIRQLESWVGATLIDRSSYPIELTPQGTAMAPQAREIVSMLHGMRAGMRSFDTPPENAVGIGAMHTLRVTFLPEWRRRIEAVTGPWAVTPVGSPAAYAQTLRHFRNGETDLLLTYVHPSVAMGLDPNHFDTMMLGRENVLPLSAPADDGTPLHRLESGEPVHFLSYGTSSFFAQALTVLLNERPLALNVVASNAMSLGLQSLAKVGAGVAWVPESLAQEDLASGALVVAGGPEWFLRVEIGLFRRREKARPIIEKIWRAAGADLAAHAVPVVARLRQT